MGVRPDERDLTDDAFARYVLPELEAGEAHDSAEEVVVGQQFDATVEDAFTHLPDRQRGGWVA